MRQSKFIIDKFNAIKRRPLNFVFCSYSPRQDATKMMSNNLRAEQPPTQVHSTVLTVICLLIKEFIPTMVVSLLCRPHGINHARLNVRCQVIFM